MAQWVRLLLHKHEDLVGISRTHGKPGTVAYICRAPPERWETEDSSEACSSQLSLQKEQETLF